MVALIILALGIGASTALFSVVSAVLLRPLPFPEADRLVRVWTAQPGNGLPRSGTSLPDYRAWRSENRSFEELGAYWGGSYNLTGTDRPEFLPGIRMTASVWAVLKSQPLHGRVFSADAEQWGAHHVVVLGERLWQRRFGGDPQVVGRAIETQRPIAYRRWRDAELLIVSLQRVVQVDPGFQTDHLLTASVTLPPIRYGNAERVEAFIGQAVEGTTAIPGIRAAGATTTYPLAGNDWRKFFSVDGRPAPPTLAQVPLVNYRQVTTDYFRTMGASLRRGRLFQADDRPGQPPVAMINETIARRFWPNEDPMPAHLHESASIAGAGGDSPERQRGSSRRSWTKTLSTNSSSALCQSS